MSSNLTRTSGQPLGSRGLQLIDLVQIVDLRLDRVHNQALHLFGTRARVRDRDSYPVEVYLRIQFPRHAEKTDAAEAEQSRP